MKTQTKTEVRNNTAKATKLLRGIDNEVASINKASEALNKRVATVAKNAAQAATLLVGISNTALATPAVTKPAVKPAAKKVDTKAAKKAAKKAAAKTAKAAKKAVAKAKPAAKAAAKKPVKATAKKAAKAAGVKKPTAAKAAPAKPVKAGERPPLTQLMKAVLDKTPDVTAAAINAALIAQGFKFSRQSQYNQLKKTELFNKKGEGAAATFRNMAVVAKAAAAPAAKTTDADADAFVAKATENPTTAAAS